MTVEEDREKADDHHGPEEESEDLHMCGACKARFPRYPAFVHHKSVCRLRRRKEDLGKAVKTVGGTPQTAAARVLANSEKPGAKVVALSARPLETVRMTPRPEVPTTAFPRLSEEEEEDLEERMEIVTVEESASLTFYVRSSTDSPSPHEGR
jgi:hypothetical protein